MPPPPPLPQSYQFYKNHLANYDAFLACLASVALNGLPAVSSHTAISNIRDSTFQNTNLRVGAISDHFLACMAAVAVGKAL